jgi:hypothetical protein
MSVAKKSGLRSVSNACSAVTSANRSMILLSAVVNRKAETRRVCPDRHTFRPVKVYTMRRIRTVFGMVEVRNPRWTLCSDFHPRMVDALAPLKEICPDRATPELMELTARLRSTMPYRQAASLFAETPAYRTDRDGCDRAKADNQGRQEARRPDHWGNLI